MKRAGIVVCMGQVGGAYWDLVGKTEGKKAVVRSGHTWGGNIKMDRKSL